MPQCLWPHNHSNTLKLQAKRTNTIWLISNTYKTCTPSKSGSSYNRRWFQTIAVFTSQCRHPRSIFNPISQSIPNCSMTPTTRMLKGIWRHKSWLSTGRIKSTISTWAITLTSHATPWRNHKRRERAGLKTLTNISTAYRVATVAERRPP